MSVYFEFKTLKAYLFQVGQLHRDVLLTARIRKQQVYSHASQSVRLY